jgi:hypothetical protein
LGGVEFNKGACFGACLLSLFGLLLSVVGFMVVITLSLGYSHYISDITIILYYWEKMEFYRHPKKPFSFREVHQRFFEIAIALFAMLSIFYAYYAYHGSENSAYCAHHKCEYKTLPALTLEQVALLATAFVVIFVFVELLYRWRWEKYDTEHSLFRKALQYDFDGKYRDEWSKWFTDPDPKYRNTKFQEKYRKDIIKDAKKRGILK